MRVKILKYLFYLTLFSIIPGPLGILPLGIGQVNVYVTDIFVGFIGLIWITNIRQAIKIIKADTVAKYFCIFLSIATLSLIFSPINMNMSEKIISGLYLIRLLAYFFVYLTSRKLIKEKIISGDFILKLMILIGLILASLGWLQYFMYPDLRNLYYLGWDPHFKRIFSTYLDPNYFGLVLILTLISITSGWKKNFYVWSIVKSLFVFMTLMFTYSRSSYLALVCAVVYLMHVMKRFKFLPVILLLILISALLLPRPAGVGVQLERVFSIETRVENWQHAFKIFIDHPILGIGFNTVRYAKNQYNFGQDNLIDNHAGAGFDNSFMFIAVTTGILGLSSFLIFFYNTFQRADIWAKTSLIAIIIHSLFLNSFFLPWVMVWMWVILAIGRDSSTSSG